METQTARKIAEEQQRTYAVQEAAPETAQATRARNGGGGHSATGRRRRTRREHFGVAGQCERQESNRRCEAIRLKAIGEAEAIRAPARPKPKHIARASNRSACRLHDDATDADRRRTHVRIVPDVAVNGGNASGGVGGWFAGIM